MHDALIQFSKQFSFTPVATLPLGKEYDSIVVCAMGGSALAASFIQMLAPELPLSLHRDYGLPRVLSKKALIVLMSESGSTEEVLSAAEETRRRKAKTVVAVTTDNSPLALWAEENTVPCIPLPDTTLEPRMALGHQLLALAYALQDESLASTIRAAGKALKHTTGKVAGETLARAIHNKVPVIYAGAKQEALAYYWKITFNETAKIPAFYGVLPEVCHNEISGFDTAPKTVGLSHIYLALFLHDPDDDLKHTERMDVMADLLQEHGIPTHTCTAPGATPAARMLEQVLTVAHAACALADHYGVPDAKTPLIDEFKSRMKRRV